MSFTNLPPELRCSVYAYVLTKPVPIIVDYPHDYFVLSSMYGRLIRLESGDEGGDDDDDTEGHRQLQKIRALNIHPSSVRKNRGRTALLRVSKLVNQEATYIMFRYNTIIIEDAVVANSYIIESTTLLHQAQRLTLWIDMNKHDRNLQDWCDFICELRDHPAG
jgi:hypothetical protein